MCRRDPARRVPDRMRHMERCDAGDGGKPHLYRRFFGGLRSLFDAIEEHENQDAQQCVRQARPEFVGQLHAMCSPTMPRAIVK